MGLLLNGEETGLWAVVWSFDSALSFVMAVHQLKGARPFMAMINL